MLSLQVSTLQTHLQYQGDKNFHILLAPCCYEHFLPELSNVRPSLYGTEGKREMPKSVS